MPSMRAVITYKLIKSLSVLVLPAEMKSDYVMESICAAKRKNWPVETRAIEVLALLPQGSELLKLLFVTYWQQLHY